MWLRTGTPVYSTEKCNVGISVGTGYFPPFYVVCDSSDDVELTGFDDYSLSWLTAGMFFAGLPTGPLVFDGEPVALIWKGSVRGTQAAKKSPCTTF